MKHLPSELLRLRTITLFLSCCLGVASSTSAWATDASGSSETVLGVPTASDKPIDPAQYQGAPGQEPGARPPRGMEFDESTLNALRQQPIAPGADRGAASGIVMSLPPLSPDSGVSAPALTTSFQGISDTGMIPADPILAVGTQRVIQAVNTSVRITDRSGGGASTTLLKTLLGIPTGSNGVLFDPWVHYDHFAGRFVPLIGEAGWQTEEEIKRPGVMSRIVKVRPSLPELIRECAEPFSSIETADLQPLLDRIGDARVVLIGEASHGTSEFYRIRAEITKALIERKNFDFVAVEADWPDAYRIHDFVTHKNREEPHDWKAFARFPTWMWRNQEVLDFIHWLRDFNLKQRPRERRAGFYGLDLYSMFTSIRCVLNYLDRVDPEAAAVARTRYGRLTPWESDPASYGRAALTGRYRSCEKEVVQMLQDMSRRRVDAAMKDGEDLFDAQLNARLVADAEQYYRIMYYGSDESWNHRDTHMFETLRLLLDRYGGRSKAVIWEHNSHLGNAAATQFGKHGQINVGQLCRQAFGHEMYAIGQGTDHGTVAAASEWEGAMEIKHVRPSHPDSYERLMHLAEMDSFFLPLTKSRNQQLTSALASRRLERAIGVIYRPETERLSHYFDASLPGQFDEWIWFDETSAVRPLTTQQTAEHEAPHPFAVLDR